MKLKALAGVLLASVMTVGLVSCGGEEKPEGEYVAVLCGYPNDNIDKNMKDSIKEGRYPIKFDGDSFEFSVGYDRSEKIYTGTFEMDEKTGEIQFEYETGKGVTWEKPVKVGKDYDKLSYQAMADDLKKLNKTGTYSCFMGPVTSITDKMSNFAVLPHFVGHKSANFKSDGTSKEMLYKKGDFLCTKLYGVELDGSYKKGKDFTLNFDQLEVYKKDPDSGYDPDNDKLIWDPKESITAHYNCKKTDSTIEFSDGEWEWYNHDGDLLNDGEYLESKKYPGLISMFVTDDSEKNDPNYSWGAILLYIDDDGEIFYPAFVKAD